MSEWTLDKALKKISSPSYPLLTATKRSNGAEPNKFLPSTSTANFPGRRTAEEQGTFTLLFTPQFSETMIIHFCFPQFWRNFQEFRARSHRPVVTCRKKDLHPQFYEDAKVYCNGELVMTTGGTQKEYSVDVWSGNHPFYLGSRSALLVDADQVEKFRKKFGELSQLMEIPVLKGEIILPTKRKAGKGKKK